MTNSSVQPRDLFVDRLIGSATDYQFQLLCVNWADRDARYAHLLAAFFTPKQARDGSDADRRDRMRRRITRLSGKPPAVARRVFRRLDRACEKQGFTPAERPSFWWLRIAVLFELLAERDDLAPRRWTRFVRHLHDHVGFADLVYEATTSAEEHRLKSFVARRCAVLYVVEDSVERLDGPTDPYGESIAALSSAFFNANCAYLPTLDHLTEPPLSAGELRAWRMAVDLSQHQAAVCLGVTHQDYQRLELGCDEISPDIAETTERLVRDPSARYDLLESLRDHHRPRELKFVGVEPGRIAFFDGGFHVATFEDDALRKLVICVCLGDAMGDSPRMFITGQYEFASKRSWMLGFTMMASEQKQDNRAVDWPVSLSFAANSPIITMPAPIEAEVFPIAPNGCWDSDRVRFPEDDDVFLDPTGRLSDDDKDQARRFIDQIRKRTPGGAFVEFERAFEFFPTLVSRARCGKERAEALALWAEAETAWESTRSLNAPL